MLVSLPAHIDPDFPATIVDVAEALGGADPINLAMSLYNESEINPQIKNSIGCVGINQFCPSTAHAVGITDLDAYRELTASQQLADFVFPFWNSLEQSHHVPMPPSARDIEWLNFLPATYVPGASDSHVITRDPSIVEANRGFDQEGKGFITAGDLASALERATHENPDRWNAIAAAIESEVASRGGTTKSLRGLVTLGALGLAGAAIASYFYPAAAAHVLRVASSKTSEAWAKLSAVKI